jgi:hypothetical protein
MLVLHQYFAAHPNGKPVKLKSFRKTLKLHEVYVTSKEHNLLHKYNKPFWIILKLFFAEDSLL